MRFPSRAGRFRQIKASYRGLARLTRQRITRPIPSHGQREGQGKWSAEDQAGFWSTISAARPILPEVLAFARIVRLCRGRLKAASPIGLTPRRGRWQATGQGSGFHPVSSRLPAIFRHSLGELMGSLGADPCRSDPRPRTIRSSWWPNPGRIAHHADFEEGT